MRRVQLSSNRRESSLDKLVDATCLLGLGFVDFVVRLTANDFKEVTYEPKRLSISDATPSHLPQPLNRITPRAQLKTRRLASKGKVNLRNSRVGSQEDGAKKNSNPTSRKFGGEKFKEENRLEIRIKWLEALGAERIASALKTISILDSIQVLSLFSPHFLLELSYDDSLTDILTTFRICQREDAVSDMTEKDKLLAVDSLVLACQNAGKINTSEHGKKSSGQRSSVSEDAKLVKNINNLEDLYVKQQAEKVAAEVERLREMRKKTAVVVSHNVEFKGTPKSVKIRIL